MKYFRLMFLLLLSIAGMCKAQAYEAADWIERDSTEAVAKRIARDFPYTDKEFIDEASKECPGFNKKDLETAIAAKRIEAHDVGGKRHIFRKALRNMKLLSESAFPGRGAKASPMRIACVDTILRWSRGLKTPGSGHRVKYRFKIMVPVVDEIAHDTVRVWMPVPSPTQRQRNIAILSAWPQQYVLSDDKSHHHSIFFEQASGEPGDTLVFEYVATFDTYGEYFSTERIEKEMLPLDTLSSVYKAYTRFEPPHIVRLDSLARSIAKDQTNPYKLSEMVFDYIAQRYPWAGAREYSTIECMPEYVVERGYGDCGQVALLYISLMRTLGVPARWESGWMLHPGEKNLHDWAEVYFEGVGWVPVDVSFGRYSNATDPEAVKFYSHGIDSYRLAANSGVCDEFYPPKRFIRSETVDAQMGEVETTKGNLFYPLWDQNLEIISIEPLTKETIEPQFEAPTDMMGLVGIALATIRTEPSHRAEISTQAVMGTPVRILSYKGDWCHVMTPEGYEGWVPDSSISVKSVADFNRWRGNHDRRVVSDIRGATARLGSTMVSPLMLGTIVELDPMPTDSVPTGMTAVVLPDGRRGFTDAALTPVDQWASQPFDSQKILATAYSMLGTPYLWGGTSPAAIDCSGLVKVSYLNNGLILKRDASQQATTGTPLNPKRWREFEPGDLLFFGNEETGKVTHVGIYDREGLFVHSSGQVKLNNLDPASSRYLYSPIKAVRIHGMEGSDGIIEVKAHPWYFKL